MSDYKAAMLAERSQLASSDDTTLDESLQIEGVNSLIIASLTGAGYDTPRKVLNSTPEELSTIPGISVEMADKILDQIRKKRM